MIWPPKWPPVQAQFFSVAKKIFFIAPNLAPAPTFFSWRWRQIHCFKCGTLAYLIPEGGGYARFLTLFSNSRRMWLGVNFGVGEFAPNRNFDLDQNLRELVL